MGSDNVNKTTPVEKHDQVGKAEAETTKHTWGPGGSEVKIAANPNQPKPDQGFLNIDFKGMGDAFNQAVHGATEMISNIGKPSPEQIAEQQRAQREKEAKEAANKSADSIMDRLNHRGVGDMHTVGEISKELHAMDYTQRKAVIESLKGKFNIRTEEKNGETEVRFGGGIFGVPGEQLYP